MAAPIQFQAMSAQAEPGAYLPVDSSEVDDGLPPRRPRRCAYVLSGLFCAAVLLAVGAGARFRGRGQRGLGPLLRLDAEPYSRSQACLDTHAMSDFSSKPVMQSNGWIFGWSDGGEFRPGRSQEDSSVPNYAYWGVSEAFDGELSLPLRGHGLVRLDFGNARNRKGGRVIAALNGKPLATADPSEISLLATAAFEDGDRLSVAESNGMIVINSVVFDCTRPTTPAPTSTTTHTATTTTATTTLSSTTQTSTSTSRTSSSSSSIRIASSRSSSIASSRSSSSSSSSTSSSTAGPTTVATSTAAVAVEEPPPTTSAPDAFTTGAPTSWHGSLLSEKERQEDMESLLKARRIWLQAEDLLLPKLTTEMERGILSESEQEVQIGTRLVDVQKQEVEELRKAKQEKQHANELRRRFLQ